MHAFFTNFYQFERFPAMRHVPYSMRQKLFIINNSNSLSTLQKVPITITGNLYAGEVRPLNPVAQALNPAVKIFTNFAG